MKVGLWALVMVAVVAACGGESGGGDSTGDAGADVTPADGPFACGTNTCSATQFCIFPCCGGVAPACEPKPEGGACPAGFHEGCSFGKSCGDPAGCCEMDPCTPAPPYCADQPEQGCIVSGHECHLMCA